MIKHRILEVDDSGKWYSTNAITILYQDMDGKHLVFFLEPQGVYHTIFNGITKMSMTTEDETSENLPEDMKALKKTLVRAMRTAVKGVLMMWGDKLLTMFYGTPEHPKPPKDKHLDIINWYMDQFTRIAIAHMMRNEVILTGQFTELGNNVISVNEVTSRPIADPTKPEQGSDEPFSGTAATNEQSGLDGKGGE